MALGAAQHQPQDLPKRCPAALTAQRKGSDGIVVLSRRPAEMNTTTIGMNCGANGSFASDYGPRWQTG